MTGQRSTSAQDTPVVIQHIWTLTVTEACDADRSRDYTYVAPADFETAFAAGKRLLSKKHPNPFMDEWPDYAWHPELEIVALARGIELTSEEKSTW